MPGIPLKKASLEGISRKFFQIKGFTTREKVRLRGKSGQNHEFNMLLSQSRDKEKNAESLGDIGYGVLIKDWKRSIGVNVIIKFDQMIEDAGLEGGIIVGNDFSANAQNFAKKSGIVSYSRGELVSLLRSMNIEDL
ncbi:MAG: restriction endonuclease [Candidatus Hodarchaeota archaeon]